MSSDVPEPPTLSRSAIANDAISARESSAVRYVDRGRLGAGAMGDVRLCEDARIGREVALKKALSDTPSEEHDRARFVQEAKIQARLEHPSVVPVYDMGEDQDGVPYFTMKRVRGMTLRHVLNGRKAGTAESAHWTPRKLLTAFTTICLTIDYAHGRGVLHRDLKPSNIMLGEYGEIYVLDWGIARAPGIPDDHGTRSLSPSPDPTEEETAAGDMLGTPGYIAPEQVRGEALDARADVYSLGAILFEMLALEPLHRPDAPLALTSTLGDVDARPSARTKSGDIPPELDAICVRATASRPRDRFASARELSLAVDAFLEGDRDLERRRTLSAEHAKTSLTLTELSLASHDPVVESEERTRALAEASQSLALDPNNEDGRRALFTLLTTPPRTMPKSAATALAEYQNTHTRRIARTSSLLYASFLVIAAIGLFTVEFRSTSFLVLAAALFAGASVSLFLASRTPPAETRSHYPTIIFTSLALSSLSAIQGPLVLVPTLVMANAIGFLMQPDEKRRPVVIGMSVLAIMLPMMLEWVGLVPPAYSTSHGMVIIQNRLFATTSASHHFLEVMTIALLLAVTLLFTRFRRTLTYAERRLFLYAWQLQKLVPDANAQHRTSSLR